ncbi:MAG: NADPH-dependent assimilatory sulfite reductase hemoprotein subunit [Thermostichales cyanobacterium DRC_bins_46]
MTAAPPPADPRKLSKVEALKQASHFLRDPLAREIGQDSSHFSEAAVQILKFHGSYQQDDRDSRQERRQAGLERDYRMMLRTRQPGGYMPAPLYLTLDRLADRYGYGTLRLTTRQTIQLHGILKKDLKTVIQEIVAEMGSTLATCGDINRNVMACPAPFKNKPAYVHAHTYARKLADLLAPHTGAYYELWIDDQPIEIPPMDADVQAARQQLPPKVALPGSPEPLYGATYLPRKFKCAITVPEDNSVDIYSQDIGLIVITGKGGDLLGFNVVVGGGMGRTHGKEETFPLLAQPLGFVRPEQIYGLVQAIVAVQRDHGNRSDRKQARMKYLVHQWGIKKFRQTVETYWGEKLKPFRPLPPVQPRLDLGYLGWHEQGDGKLFLGISVLNGRIQDSPERQLKTALRRITESFAYPLQLAPTQDLLITEVEPQHRHPIDQILRECGVLPPSRPLLAWSMACPALPTCGLAITESERYLPQVLQDLEKLLQELHLEHEPLVVRMTGCPNGCARPYLAEIGLVGVQPGAYQLWLGGSPRGDRLAQLFLDKVPGEAILATLRPLLTNFAQERYSQESFGDFCVRYGWERLRQLLAGNTARIPDLGIPGGSDNGAAVVGSGYGGAAAAGV